MNIQPPRSASTVKSGTTSNAAERENAPTAAIKAADVLVDRALCDGQAGSSAQAGQGAALAKPAVPPKKPTLDTRAAAVIARISKDPSLLAEYPDHVRNDMNIVGHFLRNLSDEPIKSREQFTTLFYAGEKLLAGVRATGGIGGSFEAAKELVELDTRYLRVVNEKYLDSARFAVGLGVRIVMGDEEAGRMLTPRVREALLKILVMRDIEAMKEEVRREPEFLMHLPNAFRNNAEIVLSAVEEDLSAFTYAGHDLLRMTARFLSNDWEFDYGEGDQILFMKRDVNTDIDAGDVVNYLLTQAKAYQQAWSDDRELTPKKFWRGVQKPAFLSSLMVVLERKGKTVELTPKGEADGPTLAILPNETMYQILQYLDPFDRGDKARTSKWFNALVHASFSDLVPQHVPGPESKKHWVKDFMTLFASERANMRAFAPSRAPNTFKVPLFNAYVRQFAGDTYVSDDNKILLTVRDEQLKTGCCYHADLANEFFVVDRSAGVARQMATVKYTRVEPSRFDTSRSERWKFHGGMTANRSSPSSGTGNRLTIELGDEVRLLKKMIPDSAAKIDGALRYESVSHYHEPAFLLETPEGVTMLLDQSKYDKSPRNARVRSAFGQGTRGARLLDFDYKKQEGPLLARIRGATLRIPAANNMDAQPTMEFESDGNRCHAPPVSELAYRAVSEAASLGFDHVEDDKTPPLPEF